MKHACVRRRHKTAAFILFSIILAVLAAAAVYCIRRFLSDEREAYDEDEDEDYIDENGVCYTDEKNFVD